MYDADGNGRLDKTELFSFMTHANPTLTRQEADKTFNIVDTDKNGDISWEEFSAAMKKQNK